MMTTHLIDTILVIAFHGPEHARNFQLPSNSRIKWKLLLMLNELTLVFAAFVAFAVKLKWLIGDVYLNDC